jgi:tetratricopeptide (TPR) repeat protein
VQGSTVFRPSWFPDYGARYATLRAHAALAAVWTLASLFSFTTVPSSALAAPQETSLARRFEFRGRVVTPRKVATRTRRIALRLIQVGEPFSAETLADFDGSFRFKNLPEGVYSFSIVIPTAGEMRTTIDLTRSFADARGRIERTFTYTEDELAHEALPVQRVTVSVRELEIPGKARSEFSDARNDLRKGKIDSAKEHLLRAVKLAPEFVEALNQLGVLAYQRRAFEEAESYFRKALAKVPDAYEPLVNLGGALLSLGRAEEAVEVNRRAQEARPKDPLAAAQLGLSYYLQGNDADARNYLMLTEQLDPGHFSNPQIPLANIYLHDSDEQAAIDELQSFLKLHPDSPEADSVREQIRKAQQVLDRDSAMRSTR